MTAASNLARIEKITPRWPARSDSKARFQILMPSIETLLLKHGPSEITIQMIAEEARMPPATVYHFFPSAEAAMLAQARVYIERFERMVAEGSPQDMASWQKSWRHVSLGACELYRSNIACMRLLLGPDVPRDIQTYDKEYNVRLGRTIAARFHQFFVMPEIKDLEGIFTNAVEIADTFRRISFERHATITDAFCEESIRAVTAYLRTYIPEHLQPRR